MANTGGILTSGATTNAGTAWMVSATTQEVPKVQMSANQRAVDAQVTVPITFVDTKIN